MLAKRLATAATCCALVLGAGGCGHDKGALSSDTARATSSRSATAGGDAAGCLDPDRLTAAEIEKRAHDAMASLSSVKVSGNLVVEGQKMTLDLATDTKGNCQGTIGVADLGRIEIIHTGGTSYLKPDATFWKTIAGQNENPRAGAMAAELFKGRYLTGAKDDPGQVATDGLRVTVQMATGSGKSYVGAAAGQRLAPRGVVLVVVPTLDLLLQMIASWRKAGRSGEMHAVCSLAAKELPPGVPASTSGLVIADWISTAAKGRRPLTLFATYASAGAVRNAYAY
ncbi:DEAD/DEAH box helicase family protein [Kitasatospora sp. NPDC088346]|uniref:DEAD/DEAH box helicase family protein n=1 Tax=Kitasatospora sp. NPDC088346 TaxID=3364073 RepID=UPI0037F4983E